jgi:hypothetical protein
MPAVYLASLYDITGRLRLSKIKDARNDKKKQWKVRGAKSTENVSNFP